MIADFLMHNRLYLAAIVAFLAIFAWVYRPSARNIYETNGNIPFDGNDNAATRQEDRP